MSFCFESMGSVIGRLPTHGPTLGLRMWRKSAVECCLMADQVIRHRCRRDRAAVGGEVVLFIVFPTHTDIVFGVGGNLIRQPPMGWPEKAAIMGRGGGGRGEKKPTSSLLLSPRTGHGDSSGDRSTVGRSRQPFLGLCSSAVAGALGCRFRMPARAATDGKECARRGCSRRHTTSRPTNPNDISIRKKRDPDLCVDISICSDGFTGKKKGPDRKVHPLARAHDQPNYRLEKKTAWQA